MAADASPDFLVATIKTSDPAATGGWAFPSNGRHVTCVNASLEVIFQIAYGIHPRQIADAPEWFTKAHFDIDGIPDQPGEPNLQQMQLMYTKLLAERFHLVFHRETRDIPIYALTVNKATGDKGLSLLKPALPTEHLNAGNSGNGSERTMRFTGTSMSDFALNLNLYEDRPVIDRTSLPGRYDFTLSWTYDPAKQDEAGAPPPLFTAIKEQLGLRLDAIKGPADVYVIDRLERPSKD